MLCPHFVQQTTNRNAGRSAHHFFWGDRVQEEVPILCQHCVPIKNTMTPGRNARHFCLSFKFKMKYPGSAELFFCYFSIDVLYILGVPPQSRSLDCDIPIWLLACCSNYDDIFMLFVYVFTCPPPEVSKAMVSFWGAGDAFGQCLPMFREGRPLFDFLVNKNRHSRNTGRHGQQSLYASSRTARGPPLEVTFGIILAPSTQHGAILCIC